MMLFKREVIFKLFFHDFIMYACLLNQKLCAATSRMFLLVCACVCVCVFQLLSCVRLLATPWTVLLTHVKEEFRIKKNFAEVQLIYSVVFNFTLYSKVTQLYIHSFFFILFSIMAHHRILNVFYLWYTEGPCCLFRFLM